MSTVTADALLRLVNPSRDTPDDSSVLRELLESGFPSATEVDALIGYRPDAGRWDTATIPEGPAFSVTVGPGLVQLTARDLARAERTANRAADRHPIPPKPSRYAARRVTAWSRKSRANMVRRMVATDWRPMMRQGVPVMVTLTYPGPWRLWAPTAAVVEGHRTAFLKRYARRFGFRAAGVWKKEFQGLRANLLRHTGPTDSRKWFRMVRDYGGAPHLHLLVPLPAGVPLGVFRDWVSGAWSEVVASRRSEVQRIAGLFGDGAAFYREHAQRHAAASTRVDISEGLRCRDPRRIAVYFLKHSTKTRDGKEYQHNVPTGWVRTGRWWGLLTVERSTRTAYVNVRDYIVLRRLLRRWATANGRALFQSSRLVGGWVAVNDGPAFLADLSRALALGLTVTG